MKRLFDLAKISNYPTQPGVYLMKSEEGEVLYVGKAKNLRQRIKQYFVPGRDGRVMIPYLIAKVAFIDTLVVLSEKEALLLENHLIKQHQPRYNALLKDDKSYIALRIDHKAKWPRVDIVRYRGNPDPNGSYFGPYTSAKAARQTIELLHKLFPLRQCSDQEFVRRERPCLLYQMKRCLGPCKEKCTPAEYRLHVERTAKFLRGQDKEVLDDLKLEMERAAEELEFEKAATLLQTIRYLEKTVEKQFVDLLDDSSVDVMGVYRKESVSVVVQLLFRGGRLTGSAHFPFKFSAQDEASLLSSFVLQHYTSSLDLPGEILFPVPIEKSEAACLEDILFERLHKKIKVVCPQKGKKRVLLEMAEANAKAFLESNEKELQARESLLAQLQELLKLSSYPARIECIDNSHLAGEEAVASLVAFTDGVKDPKRFRKFRLKEALASDDYGAMREVLTRRLKRGEEDELPNLLIVDGGKGQLKVATEVLEALNVSAVEVIAFAKEKGRHDKGLSGERIFLPGQAEPIVLEKDSPVLFFLQRIRDEAHRVAIAFHRQRRSKKRVTSELEQIPGIGPKKQRLLLRHFTSVRKIKEATIEEIGSLPGISAKDAAAIYSFFRLKSSFEA